MGTRSEESRMGWRVCRRHTIALLSGGIGGLLSLNACRSVPPAGAGPTSVAAPKVTAPSANSPASTPGVSQAPAMVAAAERRACQFAGGDSGLQRPQCCGVSARARRACAAHLRLLDLEHWGVEAVTRCTAGPLMAAESDPLAVKRWRQATNRTERR
jgi:hypothetical protein